MEVLILGIRGIPAKHGGFETFAEDLACYLRDVGDHVTVYCQDSPGGKRRVEEWNDIQLIHIPVREGAIGTLQFDLLSVLDACRRPGVILTLGYNTAVLSILYRLFGRVQVMNMDGIEWRRDKWSRLQRLWLRINEFAGAKLANHLVADHPEIRLHHMGTVSAEKITTIPYGAVSVVGKNVCSLEDLGLNPGRYALVIARPEPENSILEIVKAYSKAHRGMPLVVLGNYSDTNRYHRLVQASASEEVRFLGAIYDREVVACLREFATVYLHGHRVGGTNPSLVESLAAGNPIIAHDNRFTRWVAGEHSRYFQGVDDLATILDELLEDQSALEWMKEASRNRHAVEFSQSDVLGRYRSLLSRMGSVPAKAVSGKRTDAIESK